MPQAINVYRIREVDARDDEIADVLTELHRLTFFSGASIPPFDGGHWWLAYRGSMPVAFAGVCRRRISATPDISAGSASCSVIGGIGFSCG